MNDFAAGCQECEVDGAVWFKVEIRSAVLTWSFILMRNMGIACILGLDFFKVHWHKSKFS